MNETKEIDFSKDTARSIDYNPDNMLVTFFNGHSLRISWSLARWLKNNIDEKDNKNDNN